MIGILGFKRVFILLILTALSALLAIILYSYLMPKTQSSDRELRSLKGQIQQTQNETQSMAINLEKIESQKSAFLAIQETGFFDRQDRRKAELLLKDIQDESGVNKALITIGSGNKKTHEEAEKASHIILESALKIDMSAVDDLDILQYISTLEASLPGHLTIESLNFRRDAEINNEVLRAIAGGQNPDLVSGDVNFLWRTLIPKDKSDIDTRADQWQ